MSQAVRSVAIAQAVLLAQHGKITVAEIESKADSFYAYMNKDAVPASVAAPGAEPPKPATPAPAPAAAKPPKPASPPKPAAAKPAPAKPAQSAEEAEADALLNGTASPEPEITRSDVSAVVKALIEANRRPEALALVKEFGGESVSTIPDGQVVGFVTKGRSLLAG